MYRGKCIILGFGSDALSDDGLPVRIVNELESLLEKEKYDFNTSPLGGMELLELLEGYERAVLIDTQKTGKRNPGEIIQFTNENFQETFHLSSQHDLTFLDTLRLAKEMEISFPCDILIIAIEITENKRLSFEFSEVINNKYLEISAKLKSIISGFIV